MKVILMSMPDIAPIIIHEAAIHMPNLGIASIGGNIDAKHQVYLIDLIRKRGKLKKYLSRILKKIQPDLVGLSCMSWQYDTGLKIADLTRMLLPGVKIVLGGYHATLMSEEIAASDDARHFDFLIRGEGEEACRRLVNALDGSDRLKDIPSLSYKHDGIFVHNPQGELLDLSRLKRPIRDKKRLTWGYHVMYNKIEVMETSRGCTRSCKFCSIRNMYGRNYRTFPIDRVLEDLDDIYYNKKTRWVFLADDNIVLSTKRVMELCEAIIKRKYKGLNLVVQADCYTMANNEEMVKKMAEAGCKSVFLGIENASDENLELVGKKSSMSLSTQAVSICHKYGIMVIGGLIVGFPNDDQNGIIKNYTYFKTTGVDGTWCQLLTPYPKTELRTELLEQGLVTNEEEFKLYNGMWANVRTRHLTQEELQYYFWYHKIHVLGWWEPSELARRDGKLWTAIWRYLFKPVLMQVERYKIKKNGWDGLYAQELNRLSEMNRFKDLDESD